MQGSPQWAGERFRNADASVAGGPEGDAVTQRDAIRRLITGRALRQPPVTIPTSRTGAILPTEGVWMSWLGHASALVSLGGSLILLDPVWSDRCSPSQFVGPQRLHPTPFALGDLPTISAVVISHDHYDHLDMATIKELRRPAGLSVRGAARHRGASGALGGVPARRIVELDWTESYAVDEVTLTAVAAQHFSGGVCGATVLSGPPGCWSRRRARSTFWENTGYFSGFSEIGLLRRGTHGRRHVRPGLAFDPPRPRGGGDRRQVWGSAGRADPLVHFRAGSAPLVGAGRALPRGGQRRISGGRRAYRRAAGRRERAAAVDSVVARAGPVMSSVGLWLL